MKETAPHTAIKIKATCFGLLLLFFLTSCNQPDATTPANFNIRYQAGPTHADRDSHDCIELAGANERFIISVGKNLSYFSKTSGKRVYQDVWFGSGEVDRAAVDSLYALMSRMKFWSMNETYINRDIMDGSYQRLKVSTGQKEKSVSVVNTKKKKFEAIVAELTKVAKQYAVVSPAQPSEIPSDLSVTIEEHVSGPMGVMIEYVRLLPDNGSSFTLETGERVSVEMEEGTPPMPEWAAHSKRTLTRERLGRLFNAVERYTGWKDGQCPEYDDEKISMKISASWGGKTVHEVLKAGMDTAHNPIAGNMRLLSY